MEDINKSADKESTVKPPSTKKPTSNKSKAPDSTAKKTTSKKSSTSTPKTKTFNNNTPDIVQEDSLQTEKQKINRKRKLIDRNIEILVMNTTNGGIFYRCPKTKNEYRLSSYGDTEYITIEELITMRNAHRKLLTKYYLMPIEIMDENISLDEALIYLGLDKLYDKEIYSSIINYDVDLDNIIYSEDFLQRFKRFTNDFQLIIIERAVTLFKVGKLNDYNVINFLNEFSGRDLLTK
jgi:hypothetical protein